MVKSYDLSLFEDRIKDREAAVIDAEIDAKINKELTALNTTYEADPTLTYWDAAYNVSLA